MGLGRWQRDYFGPGFAIETQDKYRLGWRSFSQPKEGGAVGNQGKTSALPRGWRSTLRHVGLQGIGWRKVTSREEVNDVRNLGQRYSVNSLS